MRDDLENWTALLHLLTIAQLESSRTQTPHRTVLLLWPKAIIWKWRHQRNCWARSIYAAYHEFCCYCIFVEWLQSLLLGSGASLSNSRLMIMSKNNSTFYVLLFDLIKQCVARYGSSLCKFDSFCIDFSDINERISPEKHSEWTWRYMTISA